MSSFERSDHHHLSSASGSKYATLALVISSLSTAFNYAGERFSPVNGLFLLPVALIVSITIIAYNHLAFYVGRASGSSLLLDEHIRLPKRLLSATSLFLLCSAAASIHWWVAGENYLLVSRLALSVLFPTILALFISIPVPLGDLRVNPVWLALPPAFLCIFYLNAGFWRTVPVPSSVVSNLVLTPSVPLVALLAIGTWKSNHTLIRDVIPLLAFYGISLRASRTLAPLVLLTIILLVSARIRTFKLKHHSLSPAPKARRIRDVLFVSGLLVVTFIPVNGRLGSQSIWSTALLGPQAVLDSVTKGTNQPTNPSGERTIPNAIASETIPNAIASETIPNAIASETIPNANHDESATNANLGQLTNRTMWWRNSINRWGEHPLNFLLGRPESTSAEGTFTSAQGVLHYLHNDHLQIVVSAGLPAFLAYLVVWVQLFVLVSRRVRALPIHTRALILVLTSSHIIDGMTQPVNIYIYSTAGAAVLVGLCIRSHLDFHETTGPFS